MTMMESQNRKRAPAWTEWEQLLLKLLPWGWLTSCSCTSVPPCNGIVTQCITAAQHWRMESFYDEK
ncbi:unnamed protein product [Caretta caretta]